MQLEQLFGSGPAAGKRVLPETRTKKGLPEDSPS
jgi:hypothetical protein